MDMRSQAVHKASNDQSSDETGAQDGPGDCAGEGVQIVCHMLT